MTCSSNSGLQLVNLVPVERSRLPRMRFAFAVGIIGDTKQKSIFLIGIFIALQVNHVVNRFARIAIHKEFRAGTGAFSAFSLITTKMIARGRKTYR